MIFVQANIEKLSKYATENNINLRWGYLMDLYFQEDFQKVFGCEFEYGEKGQISKIRFADGSETEQPSDHLMQDHEVDAIVKSICANLKTGNTRIGYNNFHELPNEKIVAAQFEKLFK